MKTLQFYKISALILLLLNVIMMVYGFIIPPKPPNEKNHILNHVIEILQLNEKQEETFKKLAIQHDKNMEVVQTNQLEWTKEYFEQKNNPVQSDSLLSLIKEGEIQKIKITKKHFKDVRNILTSSQLPNYEEFEREVLNEILLKKRPKPKR